MRKEYTKLLNLKLVHDYFVDKECKALKLVPTAATNNVLKALDIHPKPSSIGAELYYGHEEGRVAKLIEADGVVALSFVLSVQDPYFWNYSDLSNKDPKSQAYYIDNLMPADAAQGDIELDGPNGKRPSELLPLTGNIFAHNFPPKTKIELSDLQVVDALGNQIYPRGSSDSGEEDKMVSYTEESGRCEIDMRTCLTGKYSLKHKEETVATALVFTERFEQNSLGLFTIFIGDLGSQGKQIVVDQSVVETTFNLGINARAARWKYYLISNGTTKFNSFEIVDDTKSVAGEEIPKIEFEKDDKEISEGPLAGATVFVAKQPLSFRERPENIFNLKLSSSLNSNGREATSTLRLPNANANNLKYEPGDGNEKVYFSELYVYL